MIPQTSLPPSDPTAVVGRRVLAYLIDGVILAVLMIVLFANLASTTNQGSAFSAELMCEVISNGDSGYSCIASGSDVILIENDDILLILGIAAIYGFVTHLLLPAITGFSPGKAMVGLRIVHQETFTTAGIGPNIVRWLLWVVDGAPWCFPLVGLITGLSSKGHRRVGDMAAKTLVIDKKWVGKPMAIAGVNSVAATTPPPPGVNAPPFGAPPPPPMGSTISVPAPPSTPGFPTAPPPPSPETALIQPPASSPSPPPAVIDDTATLTPPTPPPPPVAPPAPIAPPATPPPPPTADPSPPPPPAAAPPPPPPAPVVNAPRPGVDAPQWDTARDTYIQWDPELSEWMEWNEAAGAWIPISQ